MGEGRRAGGFGGYLMAAYDDASGRWQPVCKLGSGFSDDNLAELSDAFGAADAAAADAPAADDEQPAWLAMAEGGALPPQYRPDAWLEPSVVWEVRAAQLMLSITASVQLFTRCPGRFSASLTRPFLLLWQVRAAQLTLSPVFRAAAGLVHPERGPALRSPSL